MLYYKKLVNQKKLIKYWLFFNGGLKMIYKVNFVFLDVFYQKNCFSEFKILISSIKKLLPFILLLSKAKGNILFVATQYIYSKTVCKNRYNIFSKKLTYRRPGLFSNFSITKHKIYSVLDFKENPTCLVFFNYMETNYLLEEVRLKNIPTVGLIPSKMNSNLVEYPVFVNNVFFHTVYFFTNFFFKLLVLEK